MNREQENNAESGEAVTRFVDAETLLYDRLPRLVVIGAVLTVLFMLATIIAVEYQVFRGTAVALGMVVTAAWDRLAERVRTW